MAWFLTQHLLKLHCLALCASRKVSVGLLPDGAISTPTYMQELLEAEGVRIEDDRVADFKSLFWRPVEELGEDWEAF